MVGTADAPIFNALPLAHGGTIGEMLQDQVCAEGVCGSVGYANVDQIELAIDRVLELGGRVNARSVEEALRTVRTAQVKLHRTKRIGVRVWNLLQNESLRVYAVENRCALAHTCDSTAWMEHACVRMSTRTIVDYNY